jgi:hypothetical protein
MVCLCAVQSLKDPAMGTMNSVMGGKVVEDWRYAYGISPQGVQGQMEKVRVWSEERKMRAGREERSDEALRILRFLGWSLRSSTHARR